MKLKFSIVIFIFIFSSLVFALPTGDDIYNSDCAWTMISVDCGGYCGCDYGDAGDEYDDTNAADLTLCPLAQFNPHTDCETRKTSSANISVPSNVDFILANLSYQVGSLGTPNAFNIILYVYNFDTPGWETVNSNSSVSPTDQKRYLTSGWLAAADYVSAGTMKVKNLIQLKCPDEGTNCGAYIFENYQYFKTTCQPPASGIWLIDNEICDLSVNDILDGNLIIINAGELTIDASLLFSGSNRIIFIAKGSQLYIRSGGQISGG